MRHGARPAELRTLSCAFVPPNQALPHLEAEPSPARLLPAHQPLAVPRGRAQRAHSRHRTPLGVGRSAHSQLAGVNPQTMQQGRGNGGIACAAPKQWSPRHRSRRVGAQALPSPADRTCLLKPSYERLEAQGRSVACVAGGLRRGRCFCRELRRRFATGRSAHSSCAHVPDLSPGRISTGLTAKNPMPLSLKHEKHQDCRQYALQCKCLALPTPKTGTRVQSAVSAASAASTASAAQACLCGTPPAPKKSWRWQLTES